MKYRFVQASATIALAATSLSAAKAEVTMADMEPMTLRVATFLGPDNPQTKVLEAFTNRLEERSGGKLEFEYYYAGSLVPTKELVSSLGSGVFDFGYVLTSYDPGAFSVDQWASKLSFSRESDPVIQILATGLSGYEWTAKMPEHTQEFKAAGILPLINSLAVSGPYGILCKEENATLDSIKGKRVRVAGEVWANEAKNIGMVPVTMPLTEVYQAFQSGVIDCWMGAYLDIAEQGLFDHGKYYDQSLSLTAYGQGAYGFNLEVWNKFPNELKEIVWDETPYLAARLITDAGTARHVSTAKVMQEVGGIIVDADPELKERVASYHEEVVAGAAASAPAAISDAATYAKQRAELSAKWDGLLADEAGAPQQYTSWSDYLAKNGTMPTPEVLAPIIEREIVSVLRKY